MGLHNYQQIKKRIKIFNNLTLEIKNVAGEKKN